MLVILTAKLSPPLSTIGQAKSRSFLGARLKDIKSRFGKVNIKKYFFIRER
jgi:hypothetical protein